MIKNASLTIYNKYLDLEDGLEKYQRTLIKNVFWQENESSNRLRAGVDESDRVLALIPILNQFEREYVSPIEFEQKEDKENCFTFTKGDFIVKGDTQFEVKGSIKSLMDNFEVYKVSSVDRNFFGRKHMQHFKVGAR